MTGELDEPETFSEATSLALSAFQAAAGLEPDGICDASTWSALVESSFTLGGRLLCRRSPMMRGDDIGELQLRLGALGFDAGRVDGIFGPMTQQAVGEFQRNAGLVSDEVCGPETVAALRRLQGRGGAAPVSGVRERDRLRRRVATSSELRVAIGTTSSMDSSGGFLNELAASLRHRGDTTVLLNDAWSEQAQATNDFGADVYLGLELCDESMVEASYFSAQGYESHGGRRLAELIVRELPAAPGWSIGVVRGMRTAILRETRPPAVLVRLGSRERVEQHRDLVVASLHRALEHWSTDPC